eukprot:1195546-Prorocentrum_minimum.AAC.5
MWMGCQIWLSSGDNLQVQLEYFCSTPDPPFSTTRVDASNCGCHLRGVVVVLDRCFRCCPLVRAVVYGDAEIVDKAHCSGCHYGLFQHRQEPLDEQAVVIAGVLLPLPLGSERRPAAGPAVQARAEGKNECTARDRDRLPATGEEPTRTYLFTPACKNPPPYSPVHNLNLPILTRHSIPALCKLTQTRKFTYALANLHPHLVIYLQYPRPSTQLFVWQLTRVQQRCMLDSSPWAQVEAAV